MKFCFEIGVVYGVMWIYLVERGRMELSGVSLLINYVCLLGTEELYILTLLGSGHHNNHEICQCRMYSRKILLMGKEFVRNM